MRISVLGSIFLHVFILLFTVLSLPLFNNNDLEMPPVIQVELIEIAEKTNVPQISKKIDSLVDRLNRVMEAAIDFQNEKLSEYFSYLATIGATTPFIGLFGTVWGIMNSFQSIAISRNTSLAVVAPGIAEALFATALGLLAAIPAVIAYNIFTSQVNDENARMYRFKEHFNVIFSRGLSTK